jgi:microcystin degradation protein MlrC
MRVAIAGIDHETNTFSPVATDLSHFESYGIVRGDAMVATHVDAHTTVAGFLAATNEPDIDVVPLMFAWANPAGTITDEAFEALLGETLEGLASRGPWDAVLLAQHGAAVAASYPDADLEVIRRVRDLVGPSVPIGVAVDMHANISAGMAEQATVIVGYGTNPHVDARERGEECARLVIATVRGQIRPTMAFESVPAVINIVRQSTLESPMREVMASATAILAEPGVLSITVSEGYPYADVPEMGMSGLAICDGSAEAAGAAARRIGSLIWAARSEFEGHPAAPVEAVADALREGAWPTVLLDVGDNIGGGGPGNSTILLDAALAAGATGLLVILHDQPAVGACLKSGIGSTVDVVVGPDTEGIHGRPIPLRGTVRRISDGRYEEPIATHGGFRFFDSGPTVLLDIGDDNLVILTSKVEMPTSIQQLLSLGVRPEGRRIIVAKGVISPQAGYGPFAKRMVMVDTTGVTTSQIGSLKYERRRRPLYPFEPEASYPPESPDRLRTGAATR